MKKNNLNCEGLPTIFQLTKDLSEKMEENSVIKSLKQCSELMQPFSMRFQVFEYPASLKGVLLELEKTNNGAIGELRKSLEPLSKWGQDYLGHS